MKSYIQLALLILVLVSTGCEKAETPPQFRIGMIGDSITSGVKAGNVPDELQALVPENYKVTNYAVPGTCMVKACFAPIWETAEFSKMVRDEPDIITVMLGTNDTNPNNVAVWPDYERDYREMIELLQSFSSNPRIVLCYPPPFYLVDPRADSLTKSDIVPILNRLANEYGLEVADTYYQVDDYPANYPDKLHPDKAGSRTIAEIIAGVLRL